MKREEKNGEKKNEEKIKRNDVICCELMCSYLI